MRNAAQTYPPADNSCPGTAAGALVEAGILSPEQLAYAERVRAKLGTDRPLFDLLRELFSIGPAQVRAALSTRGESLRLGDLLVELGYLRPEYLELALALQRENPGPPKRLGEVLVEHQLIGESKLVEALALHLGFPLEYPHLSELDAGLLAKIPLERWERHEFVPIRREGEAVVVAFADPTDPERIRAAEALFAPAQVLPAIAERSSLRAALARLAGQEAPGEPLLSAPSLIVDLIDELLDDAISRRAEAIHIEPQRESLVLRFRIDGVLATWRELPPSLAPALVHHLRVLSHSGQDTRAGGADSFVHQTDGRRLSVLGSFCPTVAGERVVLRLVDEGHPVPSLEHLGMTPAALRQVKETLLASQQGLSLVAGRSGSGRTATLHALLTALVGPRRSILALEDKSVRAIPGVAHCRLEAGGDFDATWARIEAQDPDLVAVDELRSPEAARAVLQAASGGRKVVAVCRATDSAHAYLQLAGLGLDAALLASATTGILAQRLLRRVCEACAQPDVSRRAQDLAAALDGKAGFRIGRGCDACGGTGHRGRIASFDVLCIGTEAHESLTAEIGSEEPRRKLLARSRALRLEDSLARAARGQVPLAEVWGGEREPEEGSVGAGFLAEVIDRLGTRGSNP